MRNSSDLAITVAQSPTVQIGTFPDPPCEGSEVTLFVDPLDPALNYVWTGGQTGQTFTTLSEGIYTVVAIDPLTGCKGSANETVHPCPNLCEVPTGCYIACDSGKTVCGPLGLASYEWNYIPPGSNVSTIVGMTRCITMTQDGDYSLTAENIYGCPKTSGLLEMEFIDCDSCQFSETNEPSSENSWPTGPTTPPVSSGRKPRSLDRNLRNAPLLLFAILCAAKSMWSCVTFKSSKDRHSSSPQSVQLVGAGSVDASMSRVAASLYGFILGDVKEDSLAIKVRNSVAKSLSLIHI